MNAARSKPKTIGTGVATGYTQPGRPHTLTRVNG